MISTIQIVVALVLYFILKGLYSCIDFIAIQEVLKVKYFHRAINKYRSLAYEVYDDIVPEEGFKVPPSPPMPTPENIVERHYSTEYGEKLVEYLNMFFENNEPLLSQITANVSSQFIKPLDYYPRKEILETIKQKVPERSQDLLVVCERLYDLSSRFEISTVEIMTYLGNRYGLNRNLTICILIYCETLGSSRAKSTSLDDAKQWADYIATQEVIIAIASLKVSEDYERIGVFHEEFLKRRRLGKLKNNRVFKELNAIATRIESVREHNRMSNPEWQPDRLTESILNTIKEYHETYNK